MKRKKERGVITLLRADTVASHGSLLHSRGRNLPEFYRPLLIMRAALITRQFEAKPRVGYELWMNPRNPPTFRDKSAQSR